LAPPRSQVETSKPTTSRAVTKLWLDWSGNPWLCDCPILPFVTWATEEGSWLTNVGGYHDVICYDPPRYRGYPLLDAYGTEVIDNWIPSVLVQNCKEKTTTVTPKYLTDPLMPHYKLTHTWNSTKGVANPSDGINILKLVNCSKAKESFSKASNSSAAILNVTRSFQKNKTQLRKENLTSFYANIINQEPTTMTGSLQASFVLANNSYTRQKVHNASNTTSEFSSKEMQKFSKSTNENNVYYSVIIIVIAGDLVLSVALLVLMRKKCWPHFRLRRLATVEPT